MGLQAGGAPARLVRPPGTPGAVQGFRAFGSALSGGRLTTALPNNIRLYFGDGGSSLVISAGGQTIITITAGGIVYTPGSLNVLKTTVVQVTAGAVAYAGQAVTVNAARAIQVIAGAIAYVAQEPLLDPQATVFEAVSAGVASVIGWIDQYSMGEGDLDALQDAIEAHEEATSGR